jgi:DNA-directed RNA polymerase subunit M/transcription elongation factor TFIIS
MHTPRAPLDRGELTLACAYCHKEQPAEDNRIYVNILKRQTGQSYLATRTLREDPCLRRDTLEGRDCERRTECVLFMTPTLAGEESFKQMYERSACHHQWQKLA